MADTLQEKIDRICQAKMCVFKHYCTAFFLGQTAFFLLTYSRLEGQKLPQTQVGLEAQFRVTAGFGGCQA